MVAKIATMKMFDELGLDHLKVWENCTNKHAVITEVNDCLYQKTQSNWSENVNRVESLRGSSNKLRTYKGFLRAPMKQKCISRYPCHLRFASHLLLYVVEQPL